jgi:hypothetical protein
MWPKRLIWSLNARLISYLLGPLWPGSILAGLQSHLQPPGRLWFWNQPLRKFATLYLTDAEKVDRGGRRFHPAGLAVAGLSSRDMQALQLGWNFKRTWKNCCTRCATIQRVDVSSKMQRLVEERLWPESGLPQAHAFQLEIYAWLEGAEKADLTSEPMVFLSPAD